MHVGFSGSSDDLIYVDVNGNTREYNLYEDGEVTGYAVLTYAVIKKLKVKFLYDGCWSFTMGHAGEGVRLLVPDDIMLEEMHSYSVDLHFDVPHGTQVRVYNKKGKDITDG